MSEITQYLRAVKITLEFDDVQMFDWPHAQVAVISDGKTVMEAGAISLQEFALTHNNFHWSHAAELISDASSAIEIKSIESKIENIKMYDSRKKKSQMLKNAGRGVIKRSEDTEVFSDS